MARKKVERPEGDTLPLTPGMGPFEGGKWNRGNRIPGSERPQMQKLRSYKDWGFTARDEHKFRLMLGALIEDCEKRRHEVEMQIVAIREKIAATDRLYRAAPRAK